MSNEIKIPRWHHTQVFARSYGKTAVQQRVVAAMRREQPNARIVVIGPNNMKGGHR